MLEELHKIPTFSLRVNGRKVKTTAHFGLVPSGKLGHRGALKPKHLLCLVSRLRILRASYPYLHSP
jgi:hypothetical protein